MLTSGATKGESKLKFSPIVKILYNELHIFVQNSIVYKFLDGEYVILYYKPINI